MSSRADGGHVTFGDMTIYLRRAPLWTVIQHIHPTFRLTLPFTISPEPRGSTLCSRPRQGTDVNPGGRIADRMWTWARPALADRERLPSDARPNTLTAGNNLAVWFRRDDRRIRTRRP
jgi:hypothetical protein